jgi:hypothetical protein
VKPLVEIGDIGTPLVNPEPDGDLERRSAVRRRCGCAPEYKSRVVIGVEGCGRAGERESGASPGDAIRELSRGLVSGIERLEKIEEFGEK